MTGADVSVEVAVDKKFLMLSYEGISFDLHARFSSPFAWLLWMANGSEPVMLSLSGVVEGGAGDSERGRCPSEDQKCICTLLSVTSLYNVSLLAS